MTRPRRHVLVVGAPQRSIESIAPLLTREEFEVHTADTSVEILGLVQATSFELVVVAYPPGDMPVVVLLEALRSEASACRKAGVLLLAAPGTLDEAQAFIHRGINRVASRQWPAARLWQALADLLDVAPRVALRVMAVLEVRLTSGIGHVICHTENVSASGMLLRGGDDLVPGTNFDFVFSLPSETQPINGQAEVVRLADPVRESLSGMGARFVSFADNGRDRLKAYIETQISRQLG
jgi:CheY-like chemotaxis protein